MVISIFICDISVLLYIQPKVFRLGVRQFESISQVTVCIFLIILDQSILQNRGNLTHFGPGNILLVCPHQVVVQGPEKGLSLRQSREYIKIVAADTSAYMDVEEKKYPKATFQSRVAVLVRGHIFCYTVVMVNGRSKDTTGQEADMQLFKDRSKDLKYDRIWISIGYVVIAVVAVMTFVLLHGHIDTALAEAERFATDQSAHVTGEVLGRFEDYEQICRILSTDINAVKYVKAFQSGSDAEMLTWSYELTKELSYTVKLFNIDIKNLAYYFPENDSAVTMAQWYRPGSGRAFFDAYPDLDLDTLTAAQKGISLLMDEQGNGQGWVVCRARVYGDSIGYILLMFDFGAFADRLVPDNARLFLGTQDTAFYASEEGLDIGDYVRFVEQIQSARPFDSGGGTYIGCSRQLPIGALSVFTSVHVEKFTELQRLFRQVTISTSAICLLSVLALMFYVERQVFDPLRSLIKTTQKKGRSTKEAMDMVRESYLSLVQEKEIIQDELGDLKPLGLGTLLTRLIDRSSTFISQENVDKCMRIAGLQPDDGYMVVAAYCADDPETLIQKLPSRPGGDDTPSVMYFVLDGVLRECLAPYYSGALAPISGKGYIIFARCAGKKDQDRAEVGLRQLQEAFRQCFHLELTATQPVFGTGCAEFSKCIAEVCSELAYLEFWCSEVMKEEKLGSTDAYYYRKLLRIFTNRLNAKDYSGAIESFEDILTTGLPTDVEDLDITKFRIYGVTSMLSAAIDEQFGMDREFAAGLNVEERLYRADNIGQFRSEVEKLLLEIVEHERTQGGREDRKRERDAELVRGYIQEHYRDSEISLAGVAKHFHMSDAHLSRLFKQSFGINLLEYVQRLRVEVAKELLADHSVKDAAVLAGFWDAQGLARAFKKLEGITPGDFKKTIRDREGQP